MKAVRAASHPAVRSTRTRAPTPALTRHPTSAGCHRWRSEPSPAWDPPRLRYPSVGHTLGDRDENLPLPLSQPGGGQWLESIEEELEEVKRRLSRIWQVIETTDIEMADASERIKEHRDRKEKLEVAAEEARRLLSDRRQFLDSADTIATFAEDMSAFLKTSELTQTRAFVHSFVKEIEVKPGKAAIVYSIPTPEDSPIGGADAAEVALNGRVRSSVRHGGPFLTIDRTIFEMWLGSPCDPI